MQSPQNLIAIDTPNASDVLAQFRLLPERHRRYLVEKERASVGQLEAPRAPLDVVARS